MHAGADAAEIRHLRHPRARDAEHPRRRRMAVDHADVDQPLYVVAEATGEPRRGLPSASVAPSVVAGGWTLRRTGHTRGGTLEPQRRAAQRVVLRELPLPEQC